MFVSEAGATNINIEGITFDSNKAGSPIPLSSEDEHQHNIFLNSAKDVTIEDCEFLNSIGDGIYLFGISDNTRITSCDFENQSRVGINVTEGNNVVISHCFFRNTLNVGIKSEQNQVGSRCSDLTISDCHFENELSFYTGLKVGGGVVCNGLDDSGTYTLRGLKVLGCTFQNMERAVEGMRQSEQVTIANNGIHGCRYPITMGSYSTTPYIIAREISIHHNLIDSTDYVSVDGNISFNRVDGLNFTDNIVSDSNYIRINQATRLDFSRNTINDHVQSIDLFRCSFVKAFENYFNVGANDYAFSISGNDVTYVEKAFLFNNNILSGTYIDLQTSSGISLTLVNEKNTYKIGVPFLLP